MYSGYSWKYGLIVRRLFPGATLAIDRLYVQKLVLDALQEIRIKHRWEARDTENDTIENTRSKSIKCTPELMSNEDTLKQLLARSRYLLYESSSKWNENQSKRAAIISERYPDLEKAYKLCQYLSWIFNNTKAKTSSLIRLANWDKKVCQAHIPNNVNPLSKHTQLL